MHSGQIPAAEENLKIIQKQNQLDIRSAEIKLKLAKLEMKNRVRPQAPGAIWARRIKW